jgi:mRNA-degrading endonuclease toxin of MazEF toxin-antitoxin module
MPVDCAVTLDNLRTIPRALLVESITQLDQAKMSEVCRALIRATGC